MSVPVPLTPRPVGYRVRASSPLKKVVSVDDSFSSVHNETIDEPSPNHGSSSPKHHARIHRELNAPGKVTLVPLNDDDGNETLVHTPKRKRRETASFRRAPTPAAKEVVEDELSDADVTPKQPLKRTRLGTPVPQTFFDSPNPNPDDDDDEDEGTAEEEDIPAKQTHAFSLSDPFFDIAGDGDSSDEVPEAPSIREIDDDEESLDNPFGLPDDLDQADINQTPAIPSMRSLQPAQFSSPSRSAATRHTQSPERTNSAGHTPATTKIRTYPSPTTSSLEELEQEEETSQKQPDPPHPHESHHIETVPLRRINDPTSVHREFDSIMESEGFSMVSLDTLPSAKQHLGHGTPRSRPHRASSRFLPAHLRRSLLHSPKPNSSIGYKVPPQLEEGDDQGLVSRGTPNQSAPNSLLSRPPLRLQIDRGDGKRLFANDIDQLSVRETSISPIEGSTHQTPVPEIPARTLLQRTVRAIRIAIVLQDVLLCSKHFTKTRHDLDLLFQAYDGEIRWTLRTGLKIGVVMARRRREERERRLQKEQEERRRQEEEERLVQEAIQKREEKQREKERQRREEEMRRVEEDRKQEEKRLELELKRLREEERIRNEEMERKRRLREESEKARIEREEQARKFEEAERQKRQEEEQQLQYNKQQAEILRQKEAHESQLQRESEELKQSEEKRLKAEKEQERQEQLEHEKRRLEEKRHLEELQRRNEEVQLRQKEELKRKEEQTRIQREKELELQREKELQQQQEQELELQRLEALQRKEQERKEKQRQYEAQLREDRKNEKKRVEDEKFRASGGMGVAIEYPDISDNLSPSAIHDSSQHLSKLATSASDNNLPEATRAEESNVKYPAIDFSDLDVDQTIVPKAQRATNDRTPKAHRAFLNSGLFSSSPAGEKAASSPAVGETTTILEERMRNEMARRGEEWRREREAVSKQIADANRSQVIIVDSEDEDAAQQSESEGNHGSAGESITSEHDYEADEDDEQEEPTDHQPEGKSPIEEDVNDDMDIWQEAAHDKSLSREESRGPTLNGTFLQKPQDPQGKTSPSTYNWRRKTARQGGFEYMSPPKAKTAIDRLRENEVSKLLGTPPSAVKRYYRQYGASPIQRIVVDRDGRVLDQGRGDEEANSDRDEVLDEASLVYAKADDFDGQQRPEDAVGYEGVKEVSSKSDVAVGGQVLTTPAWLKPRRPLFTQTPLPRREAFRSAQSQESGHRNKLLPVKEQAHDATSESQTKEVRDDSGASIATAHRNGVKENIRQPPIETHEQSTDEADHQEHPIPKEHDTPTFDGVEVDMPDRHVTPFIHTRRKIPLQRFDPAPSPEKPSPQRLVATRKRKKPGPKTKKPRHQKPRAVTEAIDESPSTSPRKPQSWLDRLVSLAPKWLGSLGGSDSVAVTTAEKQDQTHSTQNIEVTEKPLADVSEKRNGLVEPGHLTLRPEGKRATHKSDKSARVADSTDHHDQRDQEKRIRRTSRKSLPRKPLSTSGYFTDDHYYTLRAMYQSAKSDPAHFLYVPSPTKDALLGRSITSADGSRSRPITKLQIAVIERFKEYLSEQSTKRGGSGTIGWSDLDLLNYLFTIIVGAEIRMEKKKVWWEKHRHDSKIEA